MEFESKSADSPLVRLHRKDWYLVIGISIALLIGLFGALGVMPLRGEEGRRALVALEMLGNGNYLVPHLLGWPYINKPPLFTWLLVGVFSFFDQTGPELLRLPSLIAWMVVCVINFRVVSKELGLPEAVLSTLFLLTGVHILFFASVLSGEMDLLYGLIVYLQALTIYRGFKTNQVLKMALLSYSLMGIGFLLKGVPSFLFQGLTLLAMSASTGRWKWLLSFKHLAGILLGLVISSAYFFLYSKEGDAVAFLLNLLAEGTRKSATEGSFAELLLHLIQFPVRIIIDLLPWSLGLVFLIPGRVYKGILKHPFLRFSLVFIFANIWVYWLSPGTRMRYLYMFLPFLLTILSWGILKARIIPLKVILLAVLMLSFARIGYNIIILPAQVQALEERREYQSLVDSTLHLANGEPIKWTGKAEHLELPPALRLVGKEIPARLKAPTWLPYAIPFQIGVRSGNVVRYDPEPLAGQLYLVNEPFLEGRNATVLARFKGWGSPVVLCRFLQESGDAR